MGRLFLNILVPGILLLIGVSKPIASVPITLIEEGVPKATIYVEGPLIDRTTLEKLMRRSIHGESVTIKIDKERHTLPTDVIFRSAAVLDLNYHFKQMSGTELPVVITDDPKDIKEPAIVLGGLANGLGATPIDGSTSKEAFRLVARDDLLLVGGNSDLAVRHGAYELLRRLGCGWVMPGKIGEVIPQKSTVGVASFDITQAPDFQFRRLWYRGYQNKTNEEEIRHRWWQWRQKGGYARPEVMNIDGHVWQRFIKRNETEFKADPTMYALVRRRDGSYVRRGPQIETTHPRVIELFAEEIRRTYEKNIAEGKWTKDTAAGFPIGPADRLGYSLSPESLSAASLGVDPITGELDRTDNLVLLANRILEKVTKDYPNAHVGFYSYSVHAQYPARYRPHPNLVVEFAPINFSRFHAMTDPVSKTQNSYRTTVEKWGQLSRLQGNLLSLYGYNWNLAENLLPYTKIHIWGDELSYYHQLGFVGLNIEATKQWSVLAPSDTIFMQLAWDTSQDWETLLEEYCKHAYGRAAAPMLRYWRRLIETQRKAGMEAGSYHAFPLIFDQKWLAAALADLEEALLAADTPSDKTRIRYVGIGVDFLRLYLAFHAATLQFDFDAAERYQNEIYALWQRWYSENSDLVANEAPRYWKHFVGSFVDQARKYSKPPFRMLAPLPDELATAFDPFSAGERLNFHHPEIRDDRFIKTHTISSTWDAQGLGGLRSGAVWYRWHFQVPEDARDEPIGLLIGGVEDEARVWINGHYVGSSGEAFSHPLLYDLTAGLKKDGENLLAIQVIRNSSANELGLGGILRPSYLFTGPRLYHSVPVPRSKP